MITGDERKRQTERNRKDAARSCVKPSAALIRTLVGAREGRKSCWNQRARLSALKTRPAHPARQTQNMRGGAVRWIPDRNNGPTGNRPATDTNTSAQRDTRSYKDTLTLYISVTNRNYITPKWFRHIPTQIMWYTNTSPLADDMLFNAISMKVLVF